MECRRLGASCFENLWKFLKDAVQHGSICPKNTSDLRVFIAREWNIISAQQHLLLCHSMPTRLQAVIEASGGHTHWLSLTCSLSCDKNFMANGPFLAIERLSKLVVVKMISTSIPQNNTCW